MRRETTRWSLTRSSARDRPSTVTTQKYFSPWVHLLIRVDAGRIFFYSAASGSSMRNSCTRHGSPSDAAEVMSSAGSVLRPTMVLRTMGSRLLRARLRGGDPDLTDDELQGTIEKVEAKRQALAACLPGAKQTARVSDAVAQGRCPVLEANRKGAGWRPPGGAPGARARCGLTIGSIPRSSSRPPGQVVAGGGFDLYINHSLLLPIVPASLPKIGVA